MRFRPLALCALAALAASAALPAVQALKIAAPTVDTSLLDAAAESGATSFPADAFRLKTVSSCAGLEDVARTYLSGAFLRYGQSWGGRPYYLRGGMMAEDAVMGASPVVDKASGVTSSPAPQSPGATSVSNTNVQVAGVDEGDAVKTDGTNLYYYNGTDRTVVITRAFPADKMEVLKTIKMPDSFGEPELYVADGRLTIVASKWAQDPLAGRRWVDRSAKTAVAVYSLADLAHPTLERYLQVDGSYVRSRRVDGRLYLVSQNSLRVPYETYALPYYADTAFHADAANFGADLRALSAADVLPRTTEIRRVAVGQGNVAVGGKSVPYSAASSTAKCASVDYVLPDEETAKKLNLDPSFVTVSVVDLADAAVPAATKVVFGDAQEIHLGDGALYLAARQYSSRPWSCPRGAYCILPYFQADENTLLHKFALKGDAVTYVASTVVPGAAAGQYAMDANGGNFRIVTKASYPDHATNVFTLDAGLKKLGALTGLAKGEDFRSSRFIGDRLYLVTFQQIDPLFVISLTDPAKPSVLGELKIPGYSTYLHPYAPGKLIGLGYDTVTNQWGGTQNGGLKVDLYDVADVANPTRLSSYTLGGQGSYSDALTNPRAFVWNADRKTLLLPVTLYEKVSTGSYENKDAFQGLVALSVDDQKGISELARLTHISVPDIHAKRLDDCKQYLAPVDTKPACRTLLDGTKICTDPATTNRWVPEYCYADAADGAYFANQLWNWQRDFVKRVAFLDSWAYTLADSGAKAWDMDRSFAAVSSVDFVAK